MKREKKGWGIFARKKENVLVFLGRKKKKKPRPLRGPSLP